MEKLAVIICTYKREKYVNENIKKLMLIDNISHIFVIDNGNTLAPVKNEKVSILPNKNLGGTGGFTRGMIEAKRYGATHIFLMDDDITFDIDTIKNAINDLKNINENDWIGFAMYPDDQPNVQFEFGSYWNGIKMHPNHHNRDMTIDKNIKNNEINHKVNYSAWWSLIMPISVIDKYGYPFPFFIKFDDIEYGLRRKTENIVLYTKNKVSHENFSNKYSPALEYYLVRNSLITNALHVKCAAFKSSIRYLGKSVICYFRGSFIQMKLMNRAVNDFLGGSKFFYNVDAESNNIDIRKIANTKLNIFANIFSRPFITLFYLIKLSVKYNKVRKDFKSNFKSLTSEEYWIKTLGLKQ